MWKRTAPERSLEREDVTPERSFGRQTRRRKSKRGELWEDKDRKRTDSRFAASFPGTPRHTPWPAPRAQEAEKADRQTSRKARKTAKL
jgi:hypothetical protein